MGRPAARLWLLLAALAAGAASGCQNDLCEQPVLEACDIREADCQERVVEALACLRKTRLDQPPPVQIMSPADYEERLREQVVPNASTPIFERALRQLGMLPGDLGLVEASLQLQSSFPARDERRGRARRAHRPAGLHRVHGQSLR